MKYLKLFLLKQILLDTTMLLIYFLFFKIIIKISFDFGEICIFQFLYYLSIFIYVFKFVSFFFLSYGFLHFSFRSAY